MIIFVLLFGACGQRVSRVPLEDPRLPLEARRWLADAEDELSIAAAILDAAQDQLEEAESFRNYVDREVNPRWPRSSQASAAEDRINRMVRERLRLAQHEVDAAVARIELANIMLVQARAETAVRHDIAAYDLEPIQDAVNTARADVNAWASRIEEQRIAVDEATTAWWEAYGAYLAGGGDNSVLWIWEHGTD